MNEAISRWWWNRYLPRNVLDWGELQRFEVLAPDQQRRELSTRLLEQIRYFGAREDTLPEWREAARLADPEECWQIWPSLPIMDKRTLRERFEPEQMRERFRLDGRVSATGGSTGEPVRFFHDPRTTLAMPTAELYTRVRMGWKPGMPVLRLWGSDADIGKPPGMRARWGEKIRNEIAVDGYKLRGETSERVKEAVEASSRIAIYGFTSMLEFVSRALQAQGWQAPPGRVATAWNGGEMLFPEQAARFRSAFGAALLNRYGGREMGCLACQYRDGAGMTILRPWVFLEIVDEAGKRAAPNQPGRILATSLLCRGTPFLRYEVGDLGTFDSADQNEAGLTALSTIEGRVGGVLTLANGRSINCLFWNHLFKEFGEVREFQVIARSDSLRILLAGKAPAAQREKELRQIVSNALGGTAFEISWVEAIARTRTGKLIQVIRE